MPAVEGVGSYQVVKGDVKVQIPTRKLAAVLVTGAMLLGGSVGGVALAQDTDGQDASAASTATSDRSTVDETNATVIEADAIADGWIKGVTDASNARNTLSGAAYVTDYGRPSSFSSGLSAVPDGTTVYMQWIDTDNAVSPIYKTVTHDDVDANGDGSPGDYGFDLRAGWTDAAGTKHLYHAVAGQYYRLWIQDYQDESGNTVTMFRQAGGMFPGSLVNSVTGSNLGQFPLLGTNMQKTAVFMYVMPKTGVMTKPEAEWIDGTNNQSTLTGNRIIKGRVWLETGDGDYANSATGVGKSSGDPAAVGYKVVFSSLTAEGAAAYKSQVESQPQAKQSAVAATLLTEHPEYIAATVYTTTDSDGNYQLAFPEGTWSNGNYFYGFVMNPEGDVVESYSSYTAPLFRAPNSTTFATNPVAAPLISAWYNVGFGLILGTEVNLNITNYDVTDNPATNGDTAKLKLTGVALSPLYNKIEWRDSKGKVLATCDADGKGLTSLTEADSCTYTVPDDIADGSVITAVLVSGGNDVSADSFIVLKDTDHDGDPDATDPDNNNDGTPDDPDHTADYQHVTQGVKIDGTVVESNGDSTDGGSELPADLRGLTVTLTAKSDMTYTNNQGVQVTVPAGTVFNAGDASNWLGAKDYPVVHNFGLATFPKGDYTVSILNYGTDYSIADDSQLKDGETVSITGNTASLFVNFKKAEITDNNTPVYGGPNRVPQGGTTTIAAPTFQNAAGETTTPELADSDAFVQDGQVTLPDGTRGDFPGTITVNEDGSIVVTANDDATTGDYKIPIKVTYKDGSTDTVSVPVTVTDQDEDKDGDGVDDDKDKCANTPEGAKVDENGCSVAPSVAGGSAPAVNGIVGTPITPIEVPISNLGKATITDCKVNDLPAGLTASFADGKCTISGTPTEEGTGNYTVTISYTPADGAAATTDPATGTYTISPAESKDDDGDGVPNDKDQCANTPEGATVDGNGCTIAPSVTDDDAPTITGTVGSPITPVEVPISNPGKADITGCTVTGLPAGLTASYEDGKCVISGTPTEAVTDQPYQVVINYNQPDGDKTTGKTTDPAEGKATINPAESTPTFNPDGKDPNGNPFVVNPSADDPANCAVAPYVTLPSDTGVVYTVTDSKGNTITADANGHYVYAYGEEVTVTATPAAGYQFSGDQKIEWKFKSMAAASCLPDWNDGTTKPGVPVTLPNTNDGTKVPEGSTVTVDGPGTATLNPDGSITVTPNGDAKPGDTITVTVKDPYGNTVDTVTVTVTEPDKGPDWNDGTVTPGGSTTIPNNGGKVPDGSTVTVDGPGKATLNPDGSITVVTDDDAKPGDKITVTVKDGNGNVIDQFTITVGGVSKAQIKRGAKLAKTGSDMAAAAVVAVMGLAAGIAGVITVNKRRKSDER